MPTVSTLGQLELLKDKWVVIPSGYRAYDGYRFGDHQRVYKVVYDDNGDLLAERFWCFYMTLDEFGAGLVLHDNPDILQAERLRWRLLVQQQQLSGRIIALFAALREIDPATASVWDIQGLERYLAPHKGHSLEQLAAIPTEQAQALAEDLIERLTYRVQRYGKCMQISSLLRQLLKGATHERFGRNRQMVWATLNGRVYAANPAARVDGDSQALWPSPYDLAFEITQ